MPEGSHSSTDDAHPMDDEGKTSSSSNSRKHYFTWPGTGSRESFILVKLIVKFLLSKGHSVCVCVTDGGVQGCSQVFTQRHT